MEPGNTTMATRSDDPNYPVSGEWFKHAHWFRIAGLGMALLGLVGNTLAIVVLRQRRMWCSTACFLVVLALYDNVLLLITIFRFFASLIPRVNHTMLSFQVVVFLPINYIVQTGTIYMTVMVTMERYIAVCWPLKSKIIFSKMSASKISLLVFVWCLIYNIPHYMALDLSPRSPSAVTPRGSRPTTPFSYNNTLGSWPSPTFPYNQSVDLWPSPTVSYYNTSSSLDPGNQTSPVSVAGQAEDPYIKFPFSSYCVTIMYRVVYKLFIQLLIKYLVPWIAMMVFNIFLLRTVHNIHIMRRHRGNRSRCCPSDKGRRLTAPVIAVTTLLFLAYPFPAMEEVYCLLSANVGTGPCSQNLRLLLHLFGETARVLNSAANFFVYCLLGRRFRSSLCELMYTIRRRLMKTPHSRHQYGFSTSRTNGSGFEMPMTSACDNEQ